MWAILLKLLYTGMICAVISFLIRELYLVWLDDTVYVASFNVTSEGGQNPEAGNDFAKRIVGAQAIIARQLLDYQKRSGPDSPTDATYTLPGSSSLALPPEALKGLDITIQNINLREIFSAIRKGFSAPNEVTGHVAMAPNSVLAVVQWPRAPKPPKDGEQLTEFFIPNQVDAQSSALYVACSLAWARASQIKGDTPNIPRLQFCDFVMSLGKLYSLSNKASTPGGLSDLEAAEVRKRAADLRTYYGSPNFLSDIYRLRADLLDLLPEQTRTINEVVEAQEDRLSYAMLSPELQKLPEPERRLAAQAMARPAILLTNGKAVNIPQNWVSLLVRREADIAKVSNSTGLVRNAVGEPLGTAFVVAPNLAVTARHVVEGALDNGGGNPEFSICFGDDCTEAIAAGRVVYKGDAYEDIALIELPTHDPLIHPPLTISDPITDANTVVGRYAYVVGFSFRSSGLPEEFLDHLLKKIEGKKRVMPGRILRLNEQDKTITSDISTTAGTAGGPLIDLTSGAVLGVSFAGVWKGERGKFAYQELLGKEVRELIASRNRGEEIRVIDSTVKEPAN